VHAVAQIGRESLREMIDRGEDFVLVDARSPMSFAASHLPGAINFTPGWIDGRARRRIPDVETEIVVYCQGPDCDSSVELANRLAELGYTKIRHYAGGISDWADAGLPLEGGRVAHYPG
jgi:rhodanese-related sulfurtransferase